MRINQAAEGLECARSRCRTPPPRSGTRKPITTGYVQALFSTARRRPARWQDIANSGLETGYVLRSEIIGIQTLKAGDTVGYSGRFIVPQANSVLVLWRAVMLTAIHV